jgi:WD40 repeat protein
LVRRYIVSASGDKTVKVFNREDGALVHTFRGHTRGVACLHYFKNYVVSGSSDETIRVCIWKGGYCLYFKNYVVSGSSDKAIRMCIRERAQTWLLLVSYLVELRSHEASIT